LLCCCCCFEGEGNNKREKSVAKLPRDVAGFFYEDHEQEDGDMTSTVW